MNKSFLGAWDVPEGRDLILTIDFASEDEVQNNQGKEKKLTIHFKEDYKPMVCNATNAKAISRAFGSTKVEDWENKKISIYTATVQAFGEPKDALRVRDYAPRTDEFVCAECGQIITDATIDGKTYKARAIAENAMTKFRRYLCYDCASAER